MELNTEGLWAGWGIDLAPHRASELENSAFFFLRGVEDHLVGKALLGPQVLRNNLLDATCLKVWVVLT